jgi:hypothetical protein
MAETNQWMIDPIDAVMLRVGHQSGYSNSQSSKNLPLPYYVLKDARALPHQSVQIVQLTKSV